MHAERDWEIKLQSNTMIFEGQRLSYKRQHILTIHIVFIFQSEGLYSAYCMSCISCCIFRLKCNLTSKHATSLPDFSAFRVKLRFSSHLIIVWTEHVHVHIQLIKWHHRINYIRLYAWQTELTMQQIFHVPAQQAWVCTCGLIRQQEAKSADFCLITLDFSFLLILQRDF